MNDEVHVEHTTPRLAPSRVRRASWGAIFAGVFVTIVLQIMLTLLGVAIGVATLQPLQQPISAQGVALSSAIWLLVTGLVSIWVGSCIAGRLSGGPRRADGMLHGIVAWSVSIVAMIGFLATAIGAVLGGTGALLGSAIASRGAVEEGQNAAGSLSSQLKELMPQAGALLPPTGRGEGEQSPPGRLTALAEQDAQLGAALARMEANGGAAQSPADREEAVNLLATKHNLSQEESANLVNQWDQQFQQARAQAGQKARQAGAAAAKGISQGALWGFIALILGLLVAAWGGWAGTASLPGPTEAATVAG
jgi:hypothetical protein